MVMVFKGFRDAVASAALELRRLKEKFDVKHDIEPLIDNIEARLKPKPGEKFSGEARIVFTALKTLAEEVAEGQLPSLDDLGPLIVAGEALESTGTYRGLVKWAVSKVRPPSLSSVAEAYVIGGNAILEMAFKMGGTGVATSKDPRPLEIIFEKSFTRGLSIKLINAEIEGITGAVDRPIGALMLLSPAFWALSDPSELIRKTYAILEPGGYTAFILPLRDRRDQVNPLEPFVVISGGRPSPTLDDFQSQLLLEGYESIKVSKRDPLYCVVARKRR